MFLLRLMARGFRRFGALLWRLLRRLAWIDDAAKAASGFGARVAALPVIASALRFYRRISPLTRSVLAVNVFALAILGGGLLYLGQYQTGLIDANIDALETQGQIFGAALGEGAVSQEPQVGLTLAPEVAREMIQRLIEPTLDTRARVYDLQGNLIADTNELRGPGGLVQVSVLPPPNPGLFERLADRVYATVVWLLPAGRHYPPYVEPEVQTASSYPEVARALSGEICQRGAKRPRIRRPGRHRGGAGAALPPGAGRGPAVDRLDRHRRGGAFGALPDHQGLRLRADRHRADVALSRRHHRAADPAAGRRGRARAQRPGRDAVDPRSDQAGRRDRRAVGRAARHDRGAVAADGGDRAFRRRRRARDQEPDDLA